MLETSHKAYTCHRRVADSCKHDDEQDRLLEICVFVLNLKIRSPPHPPHLTPPSANRKQIPQRPLCPMNRKWCNPVISWDDWVRRQEEAITPMLSTPQTHFSWPNYGISVICRWPTVDNSFPQCTTVCCSLWLQLLQHHFPWTKIRLYRCSQTETSVKIPLGLRN